MNARVLRSGWPALGARAAVALTVVIGAACAGPVDEGQADDALAGADVGSDLALSGDAGTTAETNDGDTAVDVGLDLATDCPGGAFCPCSEHNECDSTMCIPTPAGNVCAKSCVENCPDGFACRLVTSPGGDSVNICVARWGRLCDPCSSDKDCESVGTPSGTCVDLGDQGSFCSVACSLDGDCPGGHACEPTFSVAGGKADRCVPVPQIAGGAAKYGECGCSSAAIGKKLQTVCHIEFKGDTGDVFAKCKGVRRCEPKGLTKCLAPPASAELCDGEDNDCDGQTDEATCDDHNACTHDACDPKRTLDGKDGCVHQVTQAPCNADDNDCTAGDRCEAGACKPGKAKDCDDSNACTKDVCLPATGCTQTDDDGAPCDDDNPCTLSDLCAGGGCEPGIAKKCKSGDPCVLAACSIATGKCAFKPMPDGVPCHDGSACTKSDACLTGTCLGKVVDCDDANPCTDDSCDSNSGCQHKPNGQPCTDSDACTEDDVCTAGKCVGKKLNIATACDDEQPCTTDTCDAKKGCTHTAHTGSCDDGNPCTKQDACAAGVCSGANNVCQCEADSGCLPYADGDACNGTLFCDKTVAPFECKVDPKTIITCNTASDTACIANRCDKTNGACKLTPKSDGKSCDADGDVCTVADKCKAGVCAPGPVVNCDDSNPCSTDSCDKKTGCSHAANTDVCTDNDACTAGDKCSEKVCLAGKKTSCADDEPCTTDGCDVLTGKCLFTGIPGCGGYCKEAKDCDDNKVCTSDVCVQGKCLLSPNSKACDDTDKCTTNDTCADGKCGGTKRDCDDGNACTTDSCKAGIGCDHQANTLVCEDGSKCTSGDQCSAGVCQPGKSKECSDTDKCTTDACDPASGQCANKPILGCGGHCADASHCNDKNVCTDDKCTNNKCTYVNNAAPCDDGDDCSTGDVCKAGSCKGGDGVAVTTIAGSGNAGSADHVGTLAAFSSPAGIVEFGGNLFVADTGNHKIRKIDADGKVETHVGTGKAGYLDGFGKLAVLHSPYGIATDAKGNLAVSDYGSHRVRLVTQARTVATLAGSGTAGFKDGSSADARFQGPRGVASTPLGAVFVADFGNHRLRRIAPDGYVTTIAGNGVKASVDGTGTKASLVAPTAIALAASGDIFFLEATPSSRLRRATQSGVVTTIAGAGDGIFDGAGTNARMNDPRGLAIDSGGGILVADRNNHRIRKVSAAGFVSSMIGFAGSGFADGGPEQAKVSEPIGIAVNALGHVFIADTGNHRIRRVLDSTGNCSVGGKCYGAGLRKPGSPCLACDPSKSKTAWTQLSAGSPCHDGSYCTISEACNEQAACSGKTKDCDDFDKCTADSCEGATGACRHVPVVGKCDYCTTDGHCDDANACTDDKCAANTCEHTFNAAPCKSGNPCSAGEQCSQGNCVATAGVVVTTVAGKGTPGAYDGNLGQAMFDTPWRVAVGAKGALYIADHSRSRIRHITADLKTVTTIAGSNEGYLDGKGVLAQLRRPRGLDVSDAGIVYIADTDNHRIRKLDNAGNVTTLAGQGTASYKDGGPSVAWFRTPHDVFVTLGGVVVVADTGNHMIRKVDAHGNATSIAGSPNAGLVDGKGAVARFRTPMGVDGDRNGNLFVADTGNHRVRRVSADGTVTTIAGAGAGILDGPTGNALFSGPSDVGIDAAGRIWVADSGNQRIRRFEPGGTVVTVAGTGVYAFVDGTGDKARLHTPRGVGVGLDGSVFIADSDNHAIRRVFDGTRACSIGGACFADGIPNPASPCQTCQGLVAGSKWTALASGAGCDDGKPCTSSDVCGGDGSCAGVPASCADSDACTADACEAGTGQCVFTKKIGPACYCDAAKDCDDSNVCTDDACQNGKCIKTFNDNPCDAAQACSAGDTCSFGQCVALHSTLAGWLCGAGPATDGADGACNAANFYYPEFVALATDGTLYLAGSGEHRVRRIKDGVVQTMAGHATVQSYQDGIGSVARFRTPKGIGVDGDGDIYVSDHNNHCVRKLSKTGLVSTFSGNGDAGYVDGPKQLARFRSPHGIHVLGSTGIFVCDSGNNRVRFVGSDGAASTIAGTGTSGAVDGPTSGATFANLRDITLDSQGQIYVTQHSPPRIRRIGTNGVVATVLGQGGSGFADGPAATAKLSSPTGIAVDRQGRIYFADSGNHRLRKLEDDVVSTMVGQSGAGYVNAAGAGARFNNPSGIELAPTGSLIVVDTYNHRLRTVWDSADNCLIGKACWKEGFGPADAPCQECAPKTAAKSFSPRKSGVLCEDDKVCTASACDAKQACVGKKTDCDDGNPCTLDSCKAWGLCEHQTTTTCDDGDPCTLGEVCVAGKCKAEPDRWVDWSCGAGANSSPGDGPCAAATYYYPFRLRQMADGKVFVFGAEHRVRYLDKIGMADSAMKTLAGTGVAGYAVGYTTQARFNTPTDIIQLAGKDYVVSDAGNHRLRRVDSNDYVGVYAGSVAGFANGPVTAARFNRPYALLWAKGDIVFVADQHNFAIRRVHSGVVSTFSGGNGAGLTDGPPATARFRSISDMAFDGRGNIWLVSSDGHRVRKIDADGVTTTIAGGTLGFLEGKGTAARFNGPTGIALDSGGRVYIADRANHRIRVMAPDTSVSTLAGSGNAGYTQGPGSSANFNSPHGVMVDAMGTLHVADQYNHRVRRIRHSIGRCHIGGACWAAGISDPTNSCQVCDAAKAKTGWSALADGAGCDDGLPCTVADACVSGQCKAKSKPCSGSCEAGTGACGGAGN